MLRTPNKNDGRSTIFLSIFIYIGLYVAKTNILNMLWAIPTILLFNGLSDVIDVDVTNRVLVLRWSAILFGAFFIIIDICYRIWTMMS